MRSSRMPPISRMVIVPATLPLITFATSTFVSVQMALPRAIGVALTTVPSTITGDFATSCSSVGMTIVVANADALVTIIRTHRDQYTRKCFKKSLLEFARELRPLYAANECAPMEQSHVWDRVGTAQNGAGARGYSVPCGGDCFVSTSPNRFS